MEAGEPRSTTAERWLLTRTCWQYSPGRPSKAGHWHQKGGCMGGLHLATTPELPHSHTSPPLTPPYPSPAPSCTRPFPLQPVLPGNISLLSPTPSPTSQHMTAPPAISLQVPPQLPQAKTDAQVKSGLKLGRCGLRGSGPGSKWLFLPFAFPSASYPAS